MRTRADLAMQSQMLAISKAREAMAVSEFADAEAEVRAAVTAVEQAEATVGQTYTAWQRGLQSPLLGGHAASRPGAVGTTFVRCEAAR